MRAAQPEPCTCAQHGAASAAAETPPAEEILAPYSHAELNAQVKTKADMLQWIMRSRSWRYKAWFRRLNFMLIRFRPQQLRLPERDPFRGALDAPDEGGLVTRRLEVRGWAYSEGASIVRVEVFLDTISLGSLRYGLTRLDAAAYPSRAFVRCGFEGTLYVDESLAGKRLPTVRVIDNKGRVKDYERPVEVIEADCEPAAELPPAEDGDAAGGATASAAALLPQDALALAKKTLEMMYKAELESLLISDSVIEFPQHESPETSIVLVLYNRAELTLQCLHSILKHTTTPYEVIIINNASTDETVPLLERVKGARVVHNATNLHYLRACNQAARLARGRYLLLMNNDAQLLSDGVAAAVETLNSAPDIGAVGGRVVLPDGRLQEAGSIIWNDGSCLG